VSIDNFDGVLKVRLDLGQIMKFTYHLLVKNMLTGLVLV